MFVCTECQFVIVDGKKVITNVFNLSNFVIVICFREHFVMCLFYWFNGMSSCVPSCIRRAVFSYFSSCLEDLPYNVCKELNHSSCSSGLIGCTASGCLSLSSLKGFNIL